MPMPKKKVGDKKDAFIGRCMASKVMNKDYPKSTQRYAICLKQWTEELKRQKAKAGKRPTQEDFLKANSKWLRLRKSGEETKGFTMKLGNLKKIKETFKNLTTVKDSDRKKFRFGTTVISERFVSIGNLLRKAVTDKFGKGHWLEDFSRTTAIVYRDKSASYLKIDYKIVKREIAWKGAPTTVDRIVNYEQELTVKDFYALTELEKELKDNDEK